MTALFEYSSYLAWFSHSKDKAQILVEQFRSVFTKMRNFGPPGVRGSGEKGYLFSGSLGVLVIILGEVGSKLIVMWN